METVWNPYGSRMVHHAINTQATGLHDRSVGRLENLLENTRGQT